jgi:hypothetical protein
MARLNHVKSFRGTSKTKDGTITCDACGDKIKKGDPYLWWANKMGRISIRRVRCMKDECRPKPWDYMTTSPHIAGLMMAEDGAQTAVADVEWSDDAESFVDEIQDAAQEVADAVREVAEGYGEGADNMEEGFGHATYQSEELREKAETLEGQAQEVESWEASNSSPPDRDDEESEEEYGQTVEGWMEDVRSEANDAITEACQVP